MSIQSIYSELEEKYYAFLDSLDTKGIPVYKLVDPIENAGIPSMPLAAGILIIILGLVAYALFGGPAGIAGTRPIFGMH